ncbi:MAG: hypothetical protein MJ078_05050, partial [Clostridia bacterium]|nr:hypothetical protein [Clostridia bacterium]
MLHRNLRRILLLLTVGVLLVSAMAVTAFADEPIEITVTADNIIKPHGREDAALTATVEGAEIESVLYTRKESDGKITTELALADGGSIV